MEKHRITCPQCYTVLEAPEEQLGQVCRCSCCNHEFTLTAVDATPVPVSLSSVSDRASCSHMAYILLAFFLGSFGIHNFYIGRIGRGVAQLLLTVLALGLGICIVQLWIAIEILTVREDGRGQSFYPQHPGTAVILGAIKLVCLLLLVIGLLVPTQ